MQVDVDPSIITSFLSPFSDRTSRISPALLSGMADPDELAVLPEPIVAYAVEHICRDHIYFTDEAVSRVRSPSHRPRTLPFRIQLTASRELFLVHL
jgi:hypothetical protein